MLCRLANDLLKRLPTSIRGLSSQLKNVAIEASDISTNEIIVKDVTIHDEFLTEKEETSLIKEVDPYLQRLQYEFSHWDDAIHGFRETERRHWFQDNSQIIQRIREVAFPPNVAQLEYVHVLDLAKDGYIKPHIDSIKFCGSVIAGISLLSDSIMLLENEKNNEEWIKFHLPRRSLYILRGVARYDFTHAILKDDESFINGRHIPRERRISIMCRNEP